MAEQQRVVLCCEHYPPSVGGVQEVIRQIAERLVLMGLDVTVVTSVHPDRYEDVVRNGVRIVSFCITGNIVKGMVGPLDEYRSFLKSGKFDVLLIKAAQQWTFDAAVEVFPDLTCSKFFIPCGFSGLTSPLYAEYFQQMEIWIRYFDGLIFYASEYQDIEYARNLGLQSVKVIPNGVDEREFIDGSDHDIRKKLGISNDEDVILSVGTKIVGKGHWELIRAFAQANFQNSTTLIINANDPGSVLVRLKRGIKHLLTGRWPLTWLVLYYRFFILRRKIIKIVDFPRDMVLDLYKTANLFVLASHVEYSPLVLFEAAAAGTPFLATSAGNSMEIAQWTSGGYVMPRYFVGTSEVPVSALRQNLESIMQDSMGLKSIGLKGRKNIFEKGFTWESIVAQYYEYMFPKEKSSGVDLTEAMNRVG